MSNTGRWTASPQYNADMEMAEYILEILRSQPFVVMSWGFNSARVIENGIAFYVQGYLHKGRVEVVYDEGWDLFVVRTLNADGSVKEKQEGIYADGLVSTIDNMVEHCENYKQRVSRDYGLLN